MTRPACATKGATLAYLFTSIDYPDHVQAREVCRTCPLIETCAPDEHELLADGTYGGRMYINGQPKPLDWTGKYRPKSMEPIACVICGRTFLPKSWNATTCSTECRVENAARYLSQYKAQQARLRSDSVDLRERVLKLHQQGQSHRQIAMATGLSIAGVQKRITRARRKTDVA